MWRKWRECVKGEVGAHRSHRCLNRNVHLGSDKLISWYVCLGML